MKKGTKHSEETKRKISLARAKQVWSEETNNKRSETQKGRTFSKESKEKMKQHALKRFSDKKNHPSYGRIISEKERKNRSKSLKGRKLEDLHDLEKANQIRNKIKLARSKQVFPFKDTKIELKIQGFLDELGIEYETHRNMVELEKPYQSDIFIPSLNIVIEADGDYWHGHLQVNETWNDLTQKQKVQKITDYLRTHELIYNGFKVLRLWENQINKMNLEDFQNKLQVINIQ